MTGSSDEPQAGTGRSGLRRLEAVVLLLAVLATGVFFTWIGDSAAREAPSWLLPLDDAYIFLRYARQGARGGRRNGPGAAWLQGLHGQLVVLVNDAGPLSLGYGGPMIDAVGLGSNDLARPGRPSNRGGLPHPLRYRRESLPT